MRTETEMFDVILQTAKVLQVDAVAMSGSRTDTKASKDEFQDYDVVYVVDDIDNLTSDLSWLDQFSTRNIEQHNVLGNRRLYLMLFEDGNRIDLTLCPKEHIKEWVDSEADYTKMRKACLSPILQVLNVTGQVQLVRQILKKPAMNFGGFLPMWLKGFVGISSSMRPTISTVFVNKKS